MSAAAHRWLATYSAAFAGPAAISGVVKELTTPVSGRQVLLIEPGSMRVARETRSASNGAYSFPLVSENTEWIVLAFDPNGAYNAVVADRVQT